MFDFNKINQNFPIRRTDEQKQKFIDYVKQNVKNYEVNVDTYEKKHNNVVIVIGKAQKLFLPRITIRLLLAFTQT